jgi:hypothetical protein
MNDLDLFPADLQQLLQLFSALPDVRFPELDATSMQSAVARVKDRALELASIEAQLEAVRAQLDEEQEALLRKSHRLHAYLKVFAEHDEALAAKVSALTLPRLRKPAAARPVVAETTAPEVTADGLATTAVAPKKRGRPRKVVPASDALFAEATPAAAS